MSEAQRAKRNKKRRKLRKRGFTEDEVMRRVPIGGSVSGYDSILSRLDAKIGRECCSCQ